MKERIDWHDYFLLMADVVAMRSTCVRRQYGAVLVKDNRVIATGYNGTTRQQEHCTNIGCLRDELKIASGKQHEKCRAVHAEQNAIVQAAFFGINCDGAVLYCQGTPCLICMKMLANLGVKRIYYWQEYTDADAIEFANKCGIKLYKRERKYDIVKAIVNSADLKSFRIEQA